MKEEKKNAKGSGTLIVIISAIVFLIYATSTFSDVRHMKYMQEKYEENIREIYEENLHFISSQAPVEDDDELKISYDIKVYNGRNVVKPVGSVSDPSRVEIYITLNRTDDEIAEIKYKEISVTESASTAAIWDLRDKYNEYFNRYSWNDIKSTYDEENKYTISNYIGGNFVIYVKDTEGNEKTLKITDVFENWVDFQSRWYKYYDFDIGVIGVKNNEKVVEVDEVDIQNGDYSKYVGGIRKYVDPTDNKKGGRDEPERVEIRPQVDEVDMVYKVYLHNVSETTSDGVVLDKKTDAFVLKKPQIRVVNILNSNWYAYDTIYDLDWADVVYRENAGYYNKTTGEYYGNGDYWHVFDYYANTGEVKVINKIVTTKEEVWKN